MEQLAQAKQAIPPSEAPLQAYNQKQIWSYKLKSTLTQTLKTCQISPPRKPLKLFLPTWDHSHLFLPRIIPLRLISQKAQSAQITDSPEEDHTAQLKKSQNFLGSVGYRAIIAKHVTSFAFLAQHYLFCKENIPCDPLRKVIFPWQNHWIPLRGRF